MAAEALDKATISSEMPAAKAYTVEKPRFPLVLKLFLLTALLIAMVVAVAIGITITRANAVAETTVKTSITGAAKLFDDFEAQRYGRLSGVTLLAGDSNFYAYIQRALSGESDEAAQPAAPPPAAAGAPAIPPAAPVIDYSSINDTLLEQRGRLDSDVLLLLDDQGVLVARTDEPMIAGTAKEDFYDRSPLVKAIVDDGNIASTKGVLPLGNKLYHAVVAPIVAGARGIRIGYLINGYAIDEKFANNIAGATNAGVIFTTRQNASGVRSSNAPSVMPPQVRAGQTAETMVDRSRYILTTKPLLSGR